MPDVRRTVLGERSSITTIKDWVGLREEFRSRTAIGCEFTEHNPNHFTFTTTNGTTVDYELIGD